MSPRLRAELDQFNPDLPLESASCPPAAWYTNPRIAELERTRRLPQALAAGRAHRRRWRSRASTSPSPSPASRSLVVRGDDGVLRASSTSAATGPRRVMTSRRARRRAPLPLPRLDVRPRRPAPRHAGVRRRRGLRPRGQRPPAASPSPPGGRSSGSTSTVNPRRSRSFLRAARPARPGRVTSAGCTSRPRRSTTWRATGRCSSTTTSTAATTSVPAPGPGQRPRLQRVHHRELRRASASSRARIDGDRRRRDDRVGAQGRRAYYWLFPNFMLNCYEGVMDTNLVLPLGLDRAEVIFDFYFADVGDARAAPTAQHGGQRADPGRGPRDLRVGPARARLARSARGASRCAARRARTCSTACWHEGFGQGSGIRVTRIALHNIRSRAFRARRHRPGFGRPEARTADRVRPKRGGIQNDNSPSKLVAPRGCGIAGLLASVND